MNTIEVIKDALSLFYPEHNRRFESGSLTGEYYGRGGLEGLATGLWPLIEMLQEDEKKVLSEELGPSLWAYLNVWGGDAWFSAKNPYSDEDD